MALQPLPVDSHFFTRPDPLSIIKVETMTVGGKISMVTDCDVAGRDHDRSVRSPTWLSDSLGDQDLLIRIGKERGLNLRA